MTTKSETYTLLLDSFSIVYNSASENFHEKEHHLGLLKEDRVILPAGRFSARNSSPLGHESAGSPSEA